MLVNLAVAVCGTGGNSAVLEASATDEEAR
jgi:hypothetical protein